MSTITIEGKCGIRVSVVADSIYRPTGKRLVTIEAEYHRWILAECNTHRQLSKNSASSRAIPVAKMLEHVLNNPATPVFWGKNQAGMQSKEECEERVVDPSSGYSLGREAAWKEAIKTICGWSKAFADAGYHKQITNRWTETAQIIKSVISGTEWDNLLWLRDHPDAQPEFQELARCILEALNQSTPLELHEGEWHMPYYRDGFWRQGIGDSLDDAKAISVSCAAQVSYRKLDDSMEKAKDIFKRLIESTPKHLSPTEHQATPIRENTEPWNRYSWPLGVTHVSRDSQLWSGNLCGWIQHRQLIPNNSCQRYEKLAQK